MSHCIRILLVEDLKTAQKAAVTILNSLEYKVIVANCGAQALDFIINYHFDLVILDLDLPDLSGFTICETIRNLEKNKAHKPIIALTAHSTEDLPEKCRRYGIDDYIIKPLSVDNARYSIAKYFSLQKRRKYG